LSDERLNNIWVVCRTTEQK